MNDTFFMVDDQLGNGVQRVLAANVRRLRIARHLSLSELARDTGMSKATVSGIENGRANPTVETLAGLARALRISFAELLEEPPLGEIRIVRATRSQRSREGVPRRLLDAVSCIGAGELAELVLAAGQAYRVEASAERRSRPSVRAGRETDRRPGRTLHRARCRRLRVVSSGRSPAV